MLTYEFHLARNLSLQVVTLDLRNIGDKAKEASMQKSVKKGQSHKALMDKSTQIVEVRCFGVLSNLRYFCGCAPRLDPWQTNS